MMSKAPSGPAVFRTRLAGKVGNRWETMRSQTGTSKGWQLVADYTMLLLSPYKLPKHANRKWDLDSKLYSPGGSAGPP